MNKGEFSRLKKIDRLLFILIVGFSISFISAYAKDSDTASSLLFRAATARLHATFNSKLQTGAVGIYRKRGSWSLRIHYNRVQKSHSPAVWTEYAKACVNDSDFNAASQAWYRVAQLTSPTKLPQEYYHAISEAQRYETQIGIYEKTDSELKFVNQNFTHARLEPRYGCYTGAFIDHEPTVPLLSSLGSGNQRRDPKIFDQKTGVHHAFFFIYLGYGNPFPSGFARVLKEQGAGLQIAFEPTSYNEVKDDAYLRTFASDAKASGIPVFLRFASEMNGDWVAYHKSPEKYITMFRTVADVFHALAPNVAMVWCPFEIPARLITNYFPGDDVVDWVGVNIYSVLYNDNDPHRNAQGRNPADALQNVYDLYSAKHPIMIGEFGAASMSSLDMVPRTDYAVIKLDQFYTALKLRYPRVKAVHWLSMNAIVHALPGRQLNNYSLLDYPEVTQAYEGINSSDYFLKQYAPRVQSKTEYVPFESFERVIGNIHLDGWVKTYDNLPTVIWQMDGKELQRSVQPGDYGIDINSTQIPNGVHKLELIVLDEKGFEAGRETINIAVENDRTASLSLEFKDRKANK